MSEAKWYLRTQDETFGPETEGKLVEWAKLGRIQPGQEISDDNVIWRRVEEVPFLDMRFSIDIGDGNPRGPFHKAAADALLASGRLPMTASIVETRRPFGEDAPVAPVAVPESSAAVEPPVVEKVVEKPVEVIKEVEKVVEKIVEVPVEKIVEVPVEKIVEKIVEVPVEKVVEVEVPVEKIVEIEKPVEVIKEIVKEVKVEVPVEKIVEKVVEVEKPVEVIKEVIKEVKVEVEKVVVDESRIKELEKQRDDLNGVVAGLSGKLTEAGERETKLTEQVRQLEDDLRRLPQAASEVADIQAAIYSILSKETKDLAEVIEAEKREFEVVRKRYLERSDRLLERRRELLKRAGGNIEEMTRKALLERPIDPRTAQLRKELDELRRTHESAMLDNSVKIRELEEKLRDQRAEQARTAENMRDVTQLQAEVQQLREQLQVREKELIAERERNEGVRQQHAARQQALMSRLASLESPSIGTSQTLSTNQSREARQVKLPGWMRLGK